MRKVAWGIAVVTLLATGPGFADQCAKDDMEATATRLKENGAIVAFRTYPRVIAIGKPFSIEVIACVDGEKRMAPSRIRIDAAMPMHGHGMNYLPSERKLGPGHSAFDGLVFHMPGNWQYTFDVYDGDKRRRLTQKVTIGR